MANGGYQIISFNDNEVGETPITVKGSYLKASSGKAVLIEDIKFATAMPSMSFFAPAVKGEDGYALPTIVFSDEGCATIIITIADDDSVTAQYHLFSSVRTEMEVTEAGTLLATKSSNQMTKTNDGKAICGAFACDDPLSNNLVLLSKDASSATEITWLYGATSGNIEYNGVTYYYHYATGYNNLADGIVQVDRAATRDVGIISILDYYFNVE